MENILFKLSLAILSALSAFIIYIVLLFLLRFSGIDLLIKLGVILHLGGFGIFLFGGLLVKIYLRLSKALNVSEQQGRHEV